MGNTIRMGVLGAAKIVPDALVRPARQVAEVEVAAIAARDETRARAFAERHGIPRVLDSYAAVVADPDIDAVYIPLPNGLHGHWTRAAVDAGKHVLCEKPFTANADEAREVARLADASDVVVMEAFHWRHHPLVDRVLDVIASGEIGEVRHVHAAFKVPILPASDIRWSLSLAGGSLMDMGCYAVHQLRTFGGGEPTVTSATAKLRSPGIDRHVDAQVRFPSGATGRLVTGMLSGGGFALRVTVTGSAGRILILNPVAPHRGGLVFVRGANGRRRVPVERRATYAYQLEAFAHSVATGERPVTDTTNAVANMQVIDDIYRAAGMDPRQPTPA